MLMKNYYRVKEILVMCYDGLNYLELIQSW